MALPTIKFNGRAVILADTYIAGKPVYAGQIVSCTANDFGLLVEAKRAEEFNPENEAHAELAKKAATAAKAQKPGEDKEPAEDKEPPKPRR